MAEGTHRLQNYTCFLFVFGFFRWLCVSVSVPSFHQSLKSAFLYAWLRGYSEEWKLWPMLS